LGLQYKPKPNEVLSSAGKGIKVIQEHWKKKGLDISSLWMYDGSGLAVTNKVTASFVCDLLTYMITKSEQSGAFASSLPKAGLEGSVINFLKGSSLQGITFLKSGGMSRIRSYAGYINKGEKKYAVAIFVNNYNTEGRSVIKDIEKLLLSLF
jgi:D-alanyl-D-alanine carboxypeptidase/D-alanyl-D-alanine-endopeptidase (penicillin-binding protein 4)